MITCLMPVFNRVPEIFLLEEAVQSFVGQSYPHKELLICNDTPGQELLCDHPQVRIYNLDQRFASLGEKLRWMIEHANGEFLCRWDDDDINFPWRLSLSRDRIGDDRFEWRPENYWYHPRDKFVEDRRHGNSHICAIWRRECIEEIGGYPITESGAEDQMFNTLLKEARINENGEWVHPAEMFYVYRWGISKWHLSGYGDLNGTYDRIGAQRIMTGKFHVYPKWHEDYLAMRDRALAVAAS